MLNDDDPDRDKAKFFGLYEGVVVARCDPLRLKRVKVRVAQIHGPDVQDKFLPWAWPRGQMSCAEGGDGGVPPINETVYIQFKNGDHEYPVWEWGWWGNVNNKPGTPNAKLMDQAKHNVFPTSWFGGDAWPRGDILQMEQGADPKDQPNNFGIISPKQKRVELDDRKGRERLLLADWHGNNLWVNSENGAVSLESLGGNKTGGYRARGFVLRSDTQAEQEHMQYWSNAGWLLTIDDVGKFATLTSPSGHQVSIQEGDLEAMSMRTAGGHRIILSDTDRFVEMVSAAGRSLFINDNDGQLSMSGTNSQNYFFLDDKNNKIDIMCAGDISIRAGGKLNLWGKGTVDIDSNSLILFDGGNLQFNPSTFQKSESGTYIKIPDQQRSRASEFGYYQDPEST